jgi:hypothetical protein
MRKSWESQKGERAQETQTLRDMPKSQEKVIAKKKWVYPSQTKKKDKSKKSGKRKDERHKESNCW